MEKVYRLDREVTACHSCGRQPKAVHRYGKNTQRLECCPCQSRTASFPTIAEAIAAWERNEQAPVQVIHRPRLSLAR